MNLVGLCLLSLSSVSMGRAPTLGSDRISFIPVLRFKSYSKGSGQMKASPLQLVVLCGVLRTYSFPVPWSLILGFLHRDMSLLDRFFGSPVTSHTVPAFSKANQNRDGRNVPMSSCDLSKEIENYL